MKELAPASRPLLRSGGRLAGVAGFLLVYAALTAGLYKRLSLPTASAAVQVVSGVAPPRRSVGIADAQFIVDGAPFQVKAVGWDPSRPGELPWKRQFDEKLVEADFKRMREAGFNTVRSWAPLSREELALAERHELKVLQGIWVPPDGAFADPTFRRQVLAQVAGAVESSRWSRAILGYLVLNEPRANAVARAGLAETRSFLREVVATVRAVDPTALIGFASWPGLEALDDELLDFVAFNLYPHRPRVVMDELGLGAYARMIDRTLARGRPLLISEFGISVSPEPSQAGPGRGGASEEDQVSQLLELARIFDGAGTAGTAVFQWNDGWWKNNEAEGDEATHDPKDPEEWFGLMAFEDVKDRLGRPRPALAKLHARNRAQLIAPRDGYVDAEAVPVAIFSEEEGIELAVRVNGGAPHPVAVTQEGQWYRGTFALPGGVGRSDVEFVLSDATSATVRSERRLLNTAAPRQVALELRAKSSRVSPGTTFEVEVVGGAALAGQSITLASYTEDRFNEERVSLRLDSRGRAVQRFKAPLDPTMLTVLAFEDSTELPPLERAANWAAFEVRN